MDTEKSPLNPSKSLGTIMRNKREFKLSDKYFKIKERQSIMVNWDETVRKIMENDANPIKRYQYIFLDVDFKYLYGIDRALKAYIRDWCKRENFKRPKFLDSSVKLRW